ncbi:hypothetical protein BG004_002329, partial [Podila humilis]
MTMVTPSKNDAPVAAEIINNHLDHATDNSHLSTVDLRSISLYANCTNHSKILENGNSARAPSDNLDHERNSRLIQPPPPIRTQPSHHDGPERGEYPPQTFDSGVSVGRWSSQSRSSSNSNNSAENRLLSSTPRSVILPPLLDSASLLPTTTSFSSGAAGSLPSPSFHNLTHSSSYSAGPFDSPPKAAFHHRHTHTTTIPLYFLESPQDYSSAHNYHSTTVPPPTSPPYRSHHQQPRAYHRSDRIHDQLRHYPLDDHDMEHCSEQDDVRDREFGEDEEDDVDEDDKELERRRQLQRQSQPPFMDYQQRSYLEVEQERVYRASLQGDIRYSVRGNKNEDDEDVEDDEEENARSRQAKKRVLASGHLLTHQSQSSVSSVVSDLALGVRSPIMNPIVHDPHQESENESSASSSSLGHFLNSQTQNQPTQSSHHRHIQRQQQQPLPQTHPLPHEYTADVSSTKVKASSATRRRGPRPPSAQAQATLENLVHELSGGLPGEYTEEAAGQEPSGQDNIRRRVYDALNVLEALDIISMDKKEIQWIGIDNSRVLNETTKRATTPSTASHNHRRRELDEESEEPEDDDMDIEQLQRVQLDNLVARNKFREAKEHERHERRKQRKLKREEEKAAMLGDEVDSEQRGFDPVTMGFVTEEKRKKSDRHHHRLHRSSRHRHEESRAEEVKDANDRHDPSKRRNEARNQGTEKEEEQEKEEEREGDHNISGSRSGETKEERRARKQARQERRERKEARLQKRMERDSGMFLTDEEKIQLPFVVVRIPRYAGQSSDSETSISVVRRVRTDASKSKK